MADDTSSDPDQAGESIPPEAQVTDIRQLISDHYRTVYRYAYRLCGREADAEDLTQQTFLTAHRKLHQIREPDKADRWLFAVLRSCFLKSLARPRPVPMDGLEFRLEDVPQHPPAGDDVDREALQFALSDLTDDYRMVVLMYYFEDCSYKEIAEQLEIPIGTVMSRLARAKGQLRQRLFASTSVRKPPGSRSHVRMI